MAEQKDAGKARARAWTYTPPARPPLADIFKGAAQRKAFLRYWITGNIQNGFDLAMFYGMKLLPAALCSAVGARLGLFSIPRWHKGAVKKAGANLARLLPTLPQAARDALMRRNWENQGRLMTEFSVVNRMARDRQRVARHGTETIVAAAETGPLILMGLHTGNWELICPIVSSLGIAAAVNYAPPASRARHWIARRVRHQAGVRLLPPGKSAVRPALKSLQNGGTVIIFCDEGLRGRIRGPFLGRKPHLDGNLALVARLARLTGARICPVHTIRTRGAQFAFYAGPAITLAAAPATDASLIEDVTRLNAVIEPIIRQHLDQWYFLDNAL